MTQPSVYTAAMQGTVITDLAKSSLARDYVRDTADALLHQLQSDGTPPASVRIGVVMAVNATAWTADVRVAGATVPAPAVSVLGPLPDVGSTAVILSFGASYVVLGQLVGAGGTTFRDSAKNARRVDTGSLTTGALTENAWNEFPVTFGTPFGTIPIVRPSWEPTALPGATVDVRVLAGNVTSTGFTLYVWRNSTTNTNVSWVAIES